MSGTTAKKSTARPRSGKAGEARQLATILEALPDYLFELDPLGKILEYHAPRNGDLYVPPGEFVGRRVYDILPSGASEVIREALAEARESGASAGAVYPLPMKGGTRWYELSIAREETKVPGEERYVALVRDVTARRRAEVSLEERAKEDVIFSELAAQLLSASKLEEVDHLVFERARDLTGSPAGFVGHIDRPTGFLVSSTLTRDMWDSCRVPQKDFVFRDFVGLWGWVLREKKSLLTNTPSSDPRSTGIPPGHIAIERFLSAPALAGDSLVGTIALANAERDYTAEDLALVERLALLYAMAVRRVQAEGELVASQRRLAEAESRESLGLLMQGLAHELRNPLFALQTNAEALALEAGSTPGIDEHVRAIRGQVDRLEGLMRELLELSVAPSEKEFVPLSIDDLVYSAVGQFETELPWAAGRLVVDLEKPAPRLRALPSKLRGVLSELLHNALQFSPGGTPIRVSTERGPRSCLVRVRDAGTGLPKELGEKIFEPLLSTLAGHRGIGLALARHWVEVHGGTLTAADNDSAPGATFTVRLPVG